MVFDLPQIPRRNIRYNKTIAKKSEYAIYICIKKKMHKRNVVTDVFVPCDKFKKT